VFPIPHGKGILAVTQAHDHHVPVCNGAADLRRIKHITMHRRIEAIPASLAGLRAKAVTS
jgi:hypothetical protein